MTAELRRSFKEKAKERLGIGSFKIKARSADSTQDADLDSPGGASGGVAPFLSGSTTPVAAPVHPAAEGASSPWELFPPAAGRENAVNNDTAKNEDNAGQDGGLDKRKREGKRRSQRGAQPKGTIMYEVCGTDTLASIAAQFDTTTSELKKLNRMMSTMVFPGQVVYVPDEEYVASSPSTPVTSPSHETPEPAFPPLARKGSGEQTTDAEAKSDTPTKTDSKSTFEIPLVKLAERKGPGIAERLRLSGEPETPPPRPLGEEEVKRLDDECFERFIKVSVKHITDGEGVVKGVLLVTPNAIMFDPNVSDPLVMDRGADEYGMIAPMDTVISAAMYHDIAAMNRKKSSNNADQPKPEIYHSATCPMYTKGIESPPEVAEEDVGEVGKAIPERKGTRMTRSDSVCSCGALGLSLSPTGTTSPLKLSELARMRSEVTEKEGVAGERKPLVAIGDETESDSSEDEGHRAERETYHSQPVGVAVDESPLPKLQAPPPGRSSGVPPTEGATGRSASLVGTLDNGASPPSSGKPADLRTHASCDDKKDKMGLDSGPDVVTSASSCSSSGSAKAGRTDSVPDNASAAVSDSNANGGGGRAGRPAGGGADANSNTVCEMGDGAPTQDSSPADRPPGASSVTPRMQIGNIAYFQYEDLLSENDAGSPGGTGTAGAGHGEGLHRLSPTPSPTQQVPPGSPHDRAGSAGSGSPQPSSSPQQHQHPGLLSRTLGSVTSIGGSIADSISGSFPGSPNFSSFVDFSSGLFGRGHVGPQDDVTTGDVAANANAQNEAVVFRHRDPTAASPSARLSGSEVHSGNDRKSKTLHDMEVEVENIVKLNDKPELFQSLDELVPRPATRYDDPPLYLCLRIGIPRNKRISKTCPIESYMKNKRKPEYWFSIPRDKVDQLYAFFVQWSPNIYGTEEDIDPKERGFVVIDSDDENPFDVVEDHFEGKASFPRLMKSMTKDWELKQSAADSSPSDIEIVTLEEARRRISAAEIENLPLPELCEPSVVMDDTHIRRMSFHLPARAEGYPWALVYSSEKHGFSLKTLYRTMWHIDSPVLLIIKDTYDDVFGAMLPCAIKMSDHFYGSGESFLFTFYPDFKKYIWTGSNNFIIKGNAESLAIGAGKGSFGIWLDGDLYHGRTQSCETYANEILTEAEDFVIKHVEVWGFL